MPRLKRAYQRKRVKRQKVQASDCSSPKTSSRNSPELTTPSECSESTTSSHSSSYSKLEHSLSQYSEFEDDDNVYDIISVKIISDMLVDFAKCSSCSGELYLSVMKRIGLGTELAILCTACNKSKTANGTPKISTPEGKRIHEVNARLVYGMRSIGRGQTYAKTFLAIMNLPPPVKFRSDEKILKEAVRVAAEESMAAAAKKAVQENQGSKDLCVAVDGSWQKRGFSSLNGVVSATSVDTGQVLDVSVLSKHCRCQSSIHTTSCAANYEGTSGGMEVEGAIKIFSASEEKYGVRYTKYLGDGDSKAYQAVCDLAPYGENIKIKKLECVGHVQKRMGSRLRALKKRLGTKKLEDGKPISGKGRLTDALIGKIQSYYQLAIVRNKNDLQAMRQAVWATYFHLLSTNESPSHGLCTDDWCKYKKTEEGDVYDHKEHTHVAPAIMIELKETFRALSSPELLGKCLEGRTQNPNESFNNVIWSRAPKNIFVMRSTLEFCVQEAVGTFNDGNIFRCKVLKNLGIKPGPYCIERQKEADRLRVQKSEKMMMEMEQKIRQKRTLARKKLEYKQAEKEGEPAYEAGKF